MRFNVKRFNLCSSARYVSVHITFDLESLLAYLWKHDNTCWSQVNTVFQLMLVAAALLQPEFGTEETQNYITLLRLSLFHIQTIVSQVPVFWCLHAILYRGELIDYWFAWNN
jgi:hypothetical protein